MANDREKGLREPSAGHGLTKADERPKRVRCLIPADRIEAKVRELAARISADYEGKELLIVCVLKGAWIFMADLIRQLTIPVQCDFVMASSYGAGTVSSGEVKVLFDVRTDPAGKHVLIVEDIIDTGMSMPVLIEQIKNRDPASVRVCALLDKPARRRVPVQIDYVGFTIPDKFVVGYGIDWAERYRELPYIGYIE